MKIILMQVDTWKKLKIYHDPKDVIIKPDKKVVKIIDDTHITEYRYHDHRYREIVDRENDLIESAIEIVVGEELK